MDGFKNSTRVQYMKGGSCEGYAKGGSVKGAAKINKVMGEFKRGELHSGSKKGPEVTSKKQATAIALSEARKAGAKIPVKKSLGGVLKAVSPAAAIASGEPEKLLGGMGAMGLVAQLLKKKQSGQPLTAAENQKVAQAQSGMKKGGKVMKKNNGGSVEAPDALMARMTPKELAMGRAGVEAAQARLAKRETPKKAVPVASREPLISPSTMRDIRSRAKMEGVMGKNKGGLAAMPKGKKC